MEGRLREPTNLQFQIHSTDEFQRQCQWSGKTTMESTLKDVFLGVSVFGTGWKAYSTGR